MSEARRHEGTEARSERALTLRKSDWLEDWYIIEWAKHDGRQWLEPIGGGFAYQHSGRVSDADVEGTAEEMAAIACAIESGRNIGFRRCAVRFEGDGVLLFSPRNSSREERISAEQAAGLATEIRRVLAKEEGN